jgi:AraC-like DNA-binding protein
MNILIGGVLFCGLLVIMVLWKFSGRSSSSNNKMLALSLFFICYSLLVNQFIYTGYLVEVPHFSRTAIIAGNLIFPFLFVYVRNSFYPGKLWRGKDWWLLLPAAFYIIDLFPYFLLPGEEKAKMIPAIFGNNRARWRVDQGWISPYWLHFVLGYGMTFFLWVAIIKMILQNQRMEGERVSKTNKPLFSMIVMLAALYFFISFPGLIGALLDVGWFNVYFVAFSLSMTLLGVSIFLVLSPQVLYGFVYQPAPLVTEAQPQKEKAPGFDLVKTSQDIGKFDSNDDPPIQDLIDDDNLQLEPILSKIDQFMNEKKPFLKQGLSIHDLSLELEVPVYTLSRIINSGKGMNYSKWLNKYRIAYFIDLYQSVDNQQFTLESLAQKAGFISRVTFIKTFKKEMNVTPTQYIKTHFKKDLV